MSGCKMKFLKCLGYFDVISYILNKLFYCQRLSGNHQDVEAGTQRPVAKVANEFNYPLPPMELLTPLQNQGPKIHRKHRDGNKVTLHYTRYKKCHPFMSFYDAEEELKKWKEFQNDFSSSSDEDWTNGEENIFWNSTTIRMPPAPPNSIADAIIL